MLELGAQQQSTAGTRADLVQAVRKRCIKYQTILELVCWILLCRHSADLHTAQPNALASRQTCMLHARVPHTSCSADSVSVVKQPASKHKL